jgi:5-methylcytosine-specific restriction endonuclease McrA
MKIADQRSQEAALYRRLYKTKGWKGRRLRQLRSEPLCRMCLEQGRIVAASVADHIVPHKGSPELFYGGELQSLCASCHSGAKQSHEARGYSSTVDVWTGWPSDPNHPANKERA